MVSHAKPIFYCTVNAAEWRPIDRLTNCYAAPVKCGLSLQGDLVTRGRVVAERSPSSPPPCLLTCLIEDGFTLVFGFAAIIRGSLSRTFSAP